MRFRVEVVCVADDGVEQTRAVTEFTRQDLVMESLGMTLAEGMAALKAMQEFVTERQAAEFLQRARPCLRCRRPFSSKSAGTTTVRTVYGTVRLPNPRWYRCACEPADTPKTFRPLQRWLRGTTSPELLYLESKWASLIPYGGVARLLGDVLPVSETLNAELIRRDTLRTAERIEAHLGEEKAVFFEGMEEDWERQPTPDGPLTVGMDGGFVKAAHKQGFFEVIAGKSVVSFRRGNEALKPSSKCFSLVQTFDEKPRRRVWELLKSQGMQENQQVVFLSDGGDSVRNLQEYLHPASEHWLDWFHITMRLTVLQQQTKGLHAEKPELGEEVARELTSIKHFLWHGNTFQALRRLESLLYALEFPASRSLLVQKLAKGVHEFETYIHNSEELIPNFGERYRMGETITTAFVESTVNQVISKRLVKRQQMQWTPRGAHLLLQVRTKVINDELDDVFRRWHPRFRVAAAA
jgi:hypothetical protein